MERLSCLWLTAWHGRGGTCGLQELWASAWGSLPLALGPRPPVATPLTSEGDPSGPSKAFIVALYLRIMLLYLCS